MQRTTYRFVLPHGYQSADGSLQKEGEMHKGSAKEEVRAMMDPRAQEQEGFGFLLLLASVIERLGTLTQVDETIIASLSKEDLDYLKEQYRIINEG